MRTTLVDKNGRAKYTNRLIHESSAYLKQHAHNPVDWYAWGDEAFQKARQEDKPVFLSIGYATCHWCHVMEHESFDNEDIATYLNEHFICIKVDREQRPDLDEIYMAGVQIISGQGGWPMSNFLTCDGKPFYAGTYFPPDGFRELLAQLNHIWLTRKSEVLQRADELASSISQHTNMLIEAQSLGTNPIQTAALDLLDRFDAKQGGFGGAPKFPNESQLLLCLTDYQRNGNRAALDAACLTLDRMYQGGIYDQVGGGFHRYAVDSAWLVPHFEKMLYNQAQSIRVYSLAYSLTQDPSYLRIVNQTIAYIQRDMMSEEGAFYSATDADSDGEEGKFFVWSMDELEELLTADDASLVVELYGVSATGNFEGHNILNLQVSWEQFAETTSWEIEALEERLSKIREVLYQYREKRIKPLLDDKIITSWNGMMITSLTLAGWQLNQPETIACAARAADSIWQTAYTDNGLWRMSLQGQVSIPANQEDYAYLAEAMLTLHLYSGEPRWLIRAKKLIDDMLRLFLDETHGGFFLSLSENFSQQNGPLITRPKSPLDGAMPSGNSVALSALGLLFQATGDMHIQGVLSQTINGFAGLLEKSPSIISYMTIAAMNFLDHSISPVQYCANGNIKVSVRYQDDITNLHIVMSDSWHLNSPLNSHVESDGDLIPTRVTNHEVINYPRGRAITVAFQSHPINVYEGHITLQIKGKVSLVELQLQACSDVICLAPETIYLHP